MENWISFNACAHKFGEGCEKSEAGDFLLLRTVENLTCSVLPICIGPPVLNVSRRKTRGSFAETWNVPERMRTKRTLHPRSPVYRFDTPSNVARVASRFLSNLKREI